MVNGRTSFNAAVEYTCHPDFLPVGDTRKVCEEAGHWTSNTVQCDIIKCPTPSSPTGGSVSGFNREVHSTISYFCLPGHILEGDEEATCTRTGLWSSRPPNCKYVDCGNVLNIEHGIAHYVNGTTYIGSILKYSCDRSHSMLGDEERVCLPNGQWSGEAASCSEIRCSLPSRPENTVISVSSTERLHGTSVIRSKPNQENSYRVGSTLKYRCERGFILESENGYG
jgi:CUB/sushi domain-containing protein